MRDLERLQDAKTCEEQTISALKRISNRVNKSIDKLSNKVENSQMVAAVSGAVSFVSGYLLASTDEFNLEVAKNGIDVFQTQEGMIMATVAAAGVLVAGGAILRSAYLSHKIADKEDELEVLDNRIAGHEANIEEIDSKIMYSDGGEMALRNLAEETGVDYEKFKNAGREKDHEVKMDPSLNNDNFAQGIQVINITPEE